MAILKKLRLHEGSGRTDHPNHAAVYLAAPQTARSTLRRLQKHMGGRMRSLLFVASLLGKLCGRRWESA